MPFPVAAAPDDLIPPDELNFVGTGGFKAVGDEFMRYFVELGGLQPHERVLDVGCGIGRMARPLTQYLNEQGRYEGFDVVPAGIQWCRQKFTPRFPHFRFRLVDIYNKHYTPNGCCRAEHFRFPYASATFDFVFLTSVFTHLLPAEMENYVYEVARVLKVGGRCLITYLFLNREAEELIARQKASYHFQVHFPHYALVNPDVPEQTVGYEQAFALRMLADHGLAVQPPVHYGAWCGRQAYLSWQDVVVARKVRPLSVVQRARRMWARLAGRVRDRKRPGAEAA